MSKRAHNLPFAEFQDFDDWFSEIMALATSEGFDVDVTDPEKFRSFFDAQMSPWDAVSEADALRNSNQTAA